MNMNAIIITFSLSFISFFSNCSKEDIQCPPADDGLHIKDLRTRRHFVGLTIDSVSQFLLSDVIIAEKESQIPDSIIFDADSIRPDWKDNIRNYDISNNGYFSMYYAVYNPGLARPIYKNLFAYKNGYSIWRFDSTRDKLFYPTWAIDSIVIGLVKK